MALVHKELQEADFRELRAQGLEYRGIKEHKGQVVDQ